MAKTLESRSINTSSFGATGIAGPNIMVDYIQLKRVCYDDGTHGVNLDIAGKQFKVISRLSEESSIGWIDAFQKVMDTGKYRIMLFEGEDREADIFAYPQDLEGERLQRLEKLSKSSTIYDHQVKMDFTDQELEGFSTEVAKKIRNRTGLSTNDLAFGLGISNSSVNAYEYKGINKKGPINQKYLDWLKAVAGYAPKLKEANPQETIRSRKAHTNGFSLF